MARSTTIACILVFTIIGLWLAGLYATTYGWRVTGSYSSVASLEREYTDPSKVKQAAGAIEDVAMENGFVLNRPPIRLGMIDLNYYRDGDGIEIHIISIGKPNLLQVYVYDKLRKGTWEEIKKKLEAAMQSIP